MSRCKHGMLLIACAACQPPDLKEERRPQVRENQTVYGTEAVDGTEVREVGYVVITTIKGRDHHSFNRLDDKTSFVHINGHPFLWAIEVILDLCPNLRTIRVIPSNLRRLSPGSHLKLCQERGVEVITGHDRPNMVWEGENRSKFYQGQQAFFTGLQGEQRVLFEELIAFGHDGAVMTARYFCLGREEYIPQRQVADKHGFGEDERHVSQLMNAVIYYLDPSFETSERSRQIANALKGKVVRLRTSFQSVNIRQEAARRLGLSALPTDFPLVRLDELEALLKAERDGLLTLLKEEYPNAHQALTLRFGITDGVYRSLQAVGDLMGGITRERVRQLEEKALVALGIGPE